jgi:hypothetical protein
MRRISIRRLRIARDLRRTAKKRGRWRTRYLTFNKIFSFVKEQFKLLADRAGVNVQLVLSIRNH